MTEQEFITLVQNSLATCSNTEAQALLNIGTELLAQGKALSLTSMTLIEALITKTGTSK